jgi:hypothetical protein
VCVVLCAVFRLIVVLFCVMCVVCVLCLVCMLCLIVVPLPPDENPFAVKINNKNNLPMTLWSCLVISFLVINVIKQQYMILSFFPFLKPRCVGLLFLRLNQLTEIH